MILDKRGTESLEDSKVWKVTLKYMYGVAWDSLGKGCDCVCVGGEGNGLVRLFKYAGNGVRCSLKKDREL